MQMGIAQYRPKRKNGKKGKRFSTDAMQPDSNCLMRGNSASKAATHRAKRKGYLDKFRKELFDLGQADAAHHHERIGAPQLLNPRAANLYEENGI